MKVTQPAFEISPENYSLASKYVGRSGSVFLTGVQALARIPIEQLRRDRGAGRSTAAFVSGYPGSPLGGFDLEMNRALIALGGELPIEHLPAVNEELGATAVMGSQLVAGRDDALYDGVVGIWYGKAPGLDRATDALRHGVFAGSSSGGGALCLVGDDPAAKSSTMPSSSDAALVDLHMPVLYPATTAECLELGLHGIEMSRATGLWSALKVVTAVADGSGTVELPVPGSNPVIPLAEVDGKPWSRVPSAQFLGPRMVEVEREFHEVRTGLALRYGQENGLNRIEVDPPYPWLGVVATGFTFGEVIESFRRLGLPTLESIAEAGIRLLNLRMPLPFDADIVKRFADGLDQLLVVEEKNPTLETLVRSALYGTSDPPEVVGKVIVGNGPTLPTYGRLDADSIIPVLRHHLEPRISERLAPPEPKARERIPLAVERAPFFCSGCPHNWGTKVPDGAVVGMGTGCHGMTLLMDEERVGDSIGITAMGNEGTQWLGMAPFVQTDHVFQNFGDGTFMHSGQLSLQAAIGAGANITFKILYNHTVAMTGGQDASHMVDPPKLAQILLLQGVSKVAITTDDPSSYDRRSLPGGVKVHDRSKIVDIQKELALIEGVTVLIHDQGCAAELRRDRKRGRIEQPSRRVVINHRICEGCGDCGDVSSCLSVQPLDTPLGRKTQIDQASCNFDYSCMKGDCPAFMTVDAHPNFTGEDKALPELAPVDEPIRTKRESTVVRLAGIGGTGVVTVAQILATAATLDRLELAGLDQTGLSQKAGPVISDLTISTSGSTQRSNVVGRGQVDVLLAFDLLVGASDRSLSAITDDTKVFASTTTTPTGAQVISPELVGSTPDELLARVSSGSDTAKAITVDGTLAADVLAGSPASANMILLGAAYQAGELPLSIGALQQAIELNGVSIESNQAALEWGRRLVSDRESTAQLVDRLKPTSPAFTSSPLSSTLSSRIASFELPPETSESISAFAGDLMDYQSEEYAGRYLNLIAITLGVASPQLTSAVARNFHKLMAYKDEYEVARLMQHPDGLATAKSVGDKPVWHLHPPMLKALGLDSKIELNSRFSPSIKALAKGKKLRGTKLDPFGRTAMRRMERELIDEYETMIQKLCVSERIAEDTERLAVAIDLAELPDMIRGYEELKVARVSEYRMLAQQKLAWLRGPRA